MPRQNILLFIADQLRADHLGCYGNPTVRTPAIDGIAARGTRFDRFHVASPVCMPNRATLMTGRLPSLHGIRRNGIPLSKSERTFVEQLRTEGYRTALVGKAHFQPYGQGPSQANGQSSAQGLAENPARPPEAHAYPGGIEHYTDENIALWERDPGHRASLPYYGFEHVELCLYHGDTVGGDYARWLAERDPALARARGKAHALPDPRYGCRDAWRTPVPEHLHSSAYIGQRASAWLAQHAEGGQAQQPFFLMCSFPDPHHPFTPPGRFWDMYDPDQVTLPPTFRERSRYPAIDYIHAVSAGGAALPDNHHPFAPSEREAREAIALTYGLVSNMDAAIGQVLAALREAGLEDSTTVIFTSDHGDLMGDHGAMLKGPMHFSGLTRVPFLWADPRAGTPRPAAPEVCGTLDIARTVLEHTGGTVYNGLQGRSLLPLLRPGGGADGTEEAGVQIESETARLLFGRPAPYKLRSLVLRDWRLTFSTDPGMCELYDLRGDPHERHNLWDDERHRATREALVQQLLREMVRASEASPLALFGG